MDGSAAEGVSTEAGEDWAGDWVQSHLNSHAKRSKGKFVAHVLTDYHRRCIGLLCKAFRTGVYNLQIAWEKTDWHAGHGVMFTIYSSGLATFDFDHLTRLVIGAHEECIRVDVSPCAPRYLRIYMHPRVREGGMSGRHPTIEQAVANYRGQPS